MKLIADYKLSNPSWTKIPLNTWKKGQQILESFWKTWKDDYLLRLQERSKMKLKSPRYKATDTPRVVVIIQMKEDLPRGSWKMRKIVELVPSNGGKIRAAKILLATKNTVNRSLNLLFPLVCNNENEHATNVRIRKNNETNVSPKGNDQKLTNEKFVLEEKEPTQRST